MGLTKTVVVDVSSTVMVEVMNDGVMFAPMAPGDPVWDNEEYVDGGVAYTVTKLVIMLVLVTAGLLEGETSRSSWPATSARGSARTSARTITEGIVKGVCVCCYCCC